MAYYTKKELKEMGMSDAQIKAILSVQNQEKNNDESEPSVEEVPERTSIPERTNIQVHHDVEVHNFPERELVPTSIEQIATYKDGTVVELPPFGDGQPFVARITRPSLPILIRNGKIPNSLLNQATSLFANGTNALNSTGKNAANLSDLFEVVDAITEAALLEPTLAEIRSVGMELTDEQLMAIFSYTQRGIKALEQFRTVGSDNERNSNVRAISQKTE